jgi:hypothetical protein
MRSHSSIWRRRLAGQIYSFEDYSAYRVERRLLGAMVEAVRLVRR